MASTFGPVLGAEGFDSAKKAFMPRSTRTATFCKTWEWTLHNEGRCSLQHRIRRLLPITAQTLALVLIRMFAFCKQVVIQPSALFKRGELFLSWVDPILKGLYHVFIVIQFKQRIKCCLKFMCGMSTQLSRPKRKGHSSPCLKDRGLLAH